MMNGDEDGGTFFPNLWPLSKVSDSTPVLREGIWASVRHDHMQAVQMVYT